MYTAKFLQFHFTRCFAYIQAIEQVIILLLVLHEQLEILEHLKRKKINTTCFTHGFHTESG